MGYCDQAGKPIIRKNTFRKRCGSYMKILFLNSESDFKGGSEKSISILIKELTENNKFEIFLFTPSSGEIKDFLSSAM